MLFLLFDDVKLSKYIEISAVFIVNISIKLNDTNSYVMKYQINQAGLTQKIEQVGGMVHPLVEQIFIQPVTSN